LLQPLSVMQKQFLNIYIFFLVVSCYAQNKQLTYNFDQLPQTLMSNPGAVVNYKNHIGIPLLSSIYLQVGATNKNVTYNNVLAGQSSEDALRSLNNIDDLSTKDYLQFNQQLVILYGGIRLKNKKHYVSFGMYTEMDGFSLYPEDIVEIYFYNDIRI
jgi:hypothetical protein